MEPQSPENDNQNTGSNKIKRKNFFEKKREEAKRKKKEFRFPEFETYGDDVELEEGMAFDSLETIKLTDKTIKSLNEHKWSNMTNIQAKTLTSLLNFKDMLMVSKTGTGKTLAYLLPAVERAYALKYTAREGTATIVLCPTKDLAQQTFAVLGKLLKYYPQTFALVCGEKTREEEFEKLSNNKANFIVATPVRLLDHLRNTQFVWSLLNSFIIDEADLVLKDETLRNAVVEIMCRLKIPKEIYQKVFVCATLNQELRIHADNLLNKDYVTVGIDETKDMATVKNCTQAFMIVETEKRTEYLHTILKNYNEKGMKSIVFMSATLEVEFYQHLFTYLDVPVCAIHSGMEKKEQRVIMRKFCRERGMSLLCTDMIARGIDMPNVDLVVHFDPPYTIEDYIHRVGRTARAGRSGSAILMLQQSETALVSALINANIPMKQADIIGLTPVQDTLESLIVDNLYLNKAARHAFHATAKAYRSHPIKQVFNSKSLDQIKLARSFGFKEIPPNY